MKIDTTAGSTGKLDMNAVAHLPADSARAYLQITAELELFRQAKKGRAEAVTERNAQRSVRPAIQAAIKVLDLNNKAAGQLLTTLKAYIKRNLQQLGLKRVPCDRVLLQELKRAINNWNARTGS